MSGPNILWLMTDRHHAGALSCAGHPDVRTPHLDSIAAEGERFANAYVNNPICAPSRCCFMTGRPVRDHGVGGNYVWESITDDPPTIPRLLRGGHLGEAINASYRSAKITGHGNPLFRCHTPQSKMLTWSHDAVSRHFSNWDRGVTGSTSVNAVIQPHGMVYMSEFNPADYTAGAGEWRGIWP